MIFPSLHMKITNIMYFLIVALVLGFFFPDFYNTYAVEYSNYTSEQYKIKFQYPSNWNIDEKTSRFEEGSELKISSPILGEGNIFIVYAETLLELGGTDVSSATYNTLKLTIDDYKYEYKIIEKPSFFKIDNFDVGTFVYSWKDKYSDYPTLWGTQDWIIPVGNHGYLISYANLASSFDDPQNTEIRNTFIDSIEFLGNVSAIDSNKPSRFS